MVKSKMAATVNDFLSSIEKKNNAVSEEKEIKNSMESVETKELVETVVQETPKKRRGRPAAVNNNHRFTLVLDEDMYQECCRLAEEDFMSVNQFIKRLIRDKLNSIEK